MRFVSQSMEAAGRIGSVLAALALSACAAAPALKTYVLTEGQSGNAVQAVAADPPSHTAAVIEVTRVTLPPYLDSLDLVLRQGDVLERSSTGRWASRLSVGATELLTERLERRQPEAWVTDEPQSRPPDYRLMVRISRLDITRAGTGTVEAYWEIVPSSDSGGIIRGRVRFTMQGSVATDPDVADFERALLVRLADNIDVPTAQKESYDVANRGLRTDR